VGVSWRGQRLVADRSRAGRRCTGTAMRLERAETSRQQEGATGRRPAEVKRRVTAKTKTMHAGSRQRQAVAG
jgi:hypothetical protein